MTTDKILKKPEHWGTMTFSVDGTEKKLNFVEEICKDRLDVMDSIGEAIKQTGTKKKRLFKKRRLLPICDALGAIIAIWILDKIKSRKGIKKK